MSDLNEYVDEQIKGLLRQYVEEKAIGAQTIILEKIEKLKELKN